MELSYKNKCKINEIEKEKRIEGGKRQKSTVSGHSYLPCPLAPQN